MRARIVLQLEIIFRDKTQLYRKVYNGFHGPGLLGCAAGE